MDLIPNQSAEQPTHSNPSSFPSSPRFNFKFKSLIPIIGLVLMLPIIVGAVKIKQNLWPEAASPTVNIDTSLLPKTSLIFSLDQSFGNGIIHQQDEIGLNRIISTLKVFQKYYPTYALLNPMNKDSTKLEKVLDLLEQNGIPFVLDVYASDTLGIGAGNPSVANPYDLSHGIPLSIDQLTNYRNRYAYFKGVRIFEVFGSDFTHRACRTTSPEWCEPRWFSQAANPFFDANIARKFVKFAKENNLFVIWSDLHWYEFSTWDPIQQTYEQQMAQIMSDYPDVVTPMYNNNIPDGQSQGHLNIWHTAVNKFSSGAGIGLSDQAWLHDRDHMNTPISELISWANSAIAQKAGFIEFEPAWYFFSFPDGIVWDPNNYTTDPKWINRGYATDKLMSLAKGLNIPDALPTPPPTTTPQPTTETCQPRPICLDTPGSRCYPQEPPGGWCPTVTLRPSPSPIPNPKPSTMPLPTPPPGCFYQNVQCFVPPCTPVLVCPSPTPTPIPGFIGQYFPNKNLSGNPTLTRTDTLINFDWGKNASAANLSKDKFSVRWTKTETFTAGKYRFTARTDDGVRLYIDGKRVIDYWSDRSARDSKVDVNLKAGAHTIVMEYYENGGQAVAKLSWTRL